MPTLAVYPGYYFMSTLSSVAVPLHAGRGEVANIAPAQLRVVEGEHAPVRHGARRDRPTAHHREAAELKLAVHRRPCALSMKDPATAAALPWVEQEKLAFDG